MLFDDPEWTKGKLQDMERELCPMCARYAPIRSIREMDGNKYISYQECFSCKYVCEASYFRAIICVYAPWKASAGFNYRDRWNNPTKRPRKNPS